MALNVSDNQAQVNWVVLPIASQSQSWQSHRMHDERNERERGEPSPIDIVRLLAYELHRLHQSADAQDADTLAGLIITSERLTKRLEKVARALTALDKKN